MISVQNLYKICVICVNRFQNMYISLTSYGQLKFGARKFYRLSRLSKLVCVR